VLSAAQHAKDDLEMRLCVFGHNVNVILGLGTIQRNI